jgi:hypothetical protein
MPLYAKFPENALGGNSGGDSPIDFLTDTIKCALVTSSYTPNQTTHEWWSDVSANDVSGTGYTAGGAALASKTISASSLVTTLDAADPSWSSSTITARYAVFYKDTGTGGTSPLIAYADFGGNISSTNGTFTVVLNASGLATITVA